MCYAFFRAFVFFSSPISRELINYIKKDSTVLPRIGALREVIFSIEHAFLCLESKLFLVQIDFANSHLWVNCIDEFGIFSDR